jgi:hypothetical protein
MTDEEIPLAATVQNSGASLSVQVNCLVPVSLTPFPVETL